MAASASRADTSPTTRQDRGAWLLVIATSIVFAPALLAGWLEYDDDWLIRDNPLLGRSDAAVLGAVFGDLSRETRMILGAEYLPVRDLVVWLLHGVLGLGVGALHAANVISYVAAVSLLRVALRAILGASMRTELIAVLFAVHPVHAESVVWLAGLKDVLALTFTAGALYTYALDDRRAWLVVPLTALACFSKSVSVVIPALLLASDYMLRRRPLLGPLAGAFAIAASALAIHLMVGRSVGMIVEPIGGSTTAAAASMCVVALRYLGLSFLVQPNAVIYEVAVHSFSSPLVWVAIGVLVGLTALAARAHRGGERAPLFAIAIFVVALAPVSQVFAPLQNHMADRYLLVAVLGPVIALAYALFALLDRLRAERFARGAAIGIACVFAVVGGLRAKTFSDPTRLFAEATRATVENVAAPYQLGLAHQLAGEDAEAMAAYRVAYARDTHHTDLGRRAGNNLGRLLYAHGKVAEAIALYVELKARFPDDSRVANNLAIILRRLGRRDDANSPANERTRDGGTRPTPR